MSQERNRLHWKIIHTILAVGFFGLFLCAVLEKILPANPKDSGFTFVRILIFIFSGFWILGLAILTPIQILYFQRNERREAELEKKISNELIGIDGSFNPDAELPKWISIPVKIVFWAIVSFFLLSVLLVLIGLTVSKLFPETIAVQDNL